jgi:mono/diheme cytochrome c family protein
MAPRKTMEKKYMSHVRLAAAALCVALLAAPAWAQGARPAPAKPPAPETIESFRGAPFPQQTGADIFTGVCQGCHMHDAMGATGAGKYPALANNKNLAVAGYPIGIVLHGQKAMPPFKDYFNDEQIANVVNYIRTNFGNHYTDKVTAADVKTQR